MARARSKLRSDGLPVMVKKRSEDAAESGVMLVMLIHFIGFDSREL